MRNELRIRTFRLHVERQSGKGLLRIRLMEKLCQNSYTIAELANDAQRYFQDEYTKSHAIPVLHHSFEFWIREYGHDYKHGEIWKIEIRNGQWFNPAHLVKPETSHQICMGGTTSMQSVGCRLAMTVRFHKRSPLRQLGSQLLALMHTTLVNPSTPVQDARRPRRLPAGPWSRGMLRFSRKPIPCEERRTSQRSPNMKDSGGSVASTTTRPIATGGQRYSCHMMKRTNPVPFRSI